LTKTRAAIFGAVLLGGWPLWSLALFLVGGHGLLAYLLLSDLYYSGARKVFGATLFPVEEFGAIPRGTPGLLAAVALYAVVGALAGWTLASAIRWWHRQRDTGAAAQ
jgi:hypothetical protein